MVTTVRQKNLKKKLLLIEVPFVGEFSSSTLTIPSHPAQKRTGTAEPLA
jgi:hypothetical protein